MSKSASILLLLLAAALEAGGDFILRRGLLSNGNLWQRAALFSAGGLFLFFYGLAVNSPPWKFGELLGLYVVFFFVLAQVISIAAGEPSSGGRLFYSGASLILAGGVLIALSK